MALLREGGKNYDRRLLKLKATWCQMEAALKEIHEWRFLFCLFFFLGRVDTFTFSEMVACAQPRWVFNKSLKRRNSLLIMQNKSDIVRAGQHAYMCVCVQKRPCHIDRTLSLWTLDLSLVASQESAFWKNTPLFTVISWSEVIFYSGPLEKSNSEFNNPIWGKRQACNFPNFL